MLQRAPGLYYGPSNIHGRGVFCTHVLSAGDVIEICPVIVLPETEVLLLAKSRLYGYYFSWNAEQSGCAIALGYGSLYNHADAPNAEFTPDHQDDTLIIEALHEISAGAEITVDYHAGALVRRLWF
jgi:SET domain-containing protein